MKKPIKKELLNTLPVIVGGIASVVSILVFLIQFKSVEYIKFSTGILGAMLGAIVAYSIARIRTALNAPKIFISYSNNDLDFVQKLLREIEQLPVYVLFDKHELNVGDPISQKISELVDESDYFLVVISKNSSESQWIEKELENAINKKKKILPVVIDETPVPKIISDLVYADFLESFDIGVSQITKALKTSKHNNFFQRSAKNRAR
ncbi:hypothetical protein DO021_15150 [Desulfobacter hydrogenophilus]|uniref:Toll/interleukin-1 receptor domain-containing protein n=1 Tax=Desulfobacter hydrogenophilus TaxID=2291 RepID=A0A328FAB0_9BACT|nr:toll/interleukin-1 receptor domain-containing protein [Desulfobacter hydrogenophilus]NDY72837.1 toll/interleukin-1 receptor domain-containing protein [Desulfobacter hydrogenophilus]QBH13629.1 toll/interleukin-1 receptor domain-containing protein [Desulfobacter hydrogenophilus]RAM01146.1 hypothetical protein DO021_15150 [Desulfobacter hydrogenophilus]